jgi:hypothetical protein
MDDASTQQTLLAYRDQGGGLILQGDDMSQFEGMPELMEPLTNLEFLNNGTRTCGEMTDNNEGENYAVLLNTASHPVIAGLEGLSFEYGNDIDHTRPLGLGEQVLASASFEVEGGRDRGDRRDRRDGRRGKKGQEDCSVQTPAIIAIDPGSLTPTPL